MQWNSQKINYSAPLNIIMFSCMPFFIQRMPIDNRFLPVLSQEVGMVPVGDLPVISVWTNVLLGGKLVTESLYLLEPPESLFDGISFPLAVACLTRMSGFLDQGSCILCACEMPGTRPFFWVKSLGATTV